MSLTKQLKQEDGYYGNTHSTPKPTIHKIIPPERYFKVRFRPHRGNNTVLAINLSGNWLNEAGFSTGQPVKMRIMPGCIIITRQDIRKLWFLLQHPFDEHTTTHWLTQFPGGIDMTGI